MNLVPISPEAMLLSQRRVECALHFRIKLLLQVKEFKYIGTFLT